MSVKGARWRGRLVCAIDGTILGCPDTPANLAIYHRGGSGNGGTPDHSYLSRIGALQVRVITATITVTTQQGHRSEVYRLITTILDPACPPEEIVALYLQRWEIETTYFELKSTLLGGRVLRARTPPGVAQEIYALLITYQALRIAISDAVLTRPDIDPDRASFTIALHAARDQLIIARGVLTDTAPNTTIDLAGDLGRQVLHHLMPARRCRTNPRVVKRAISVYATNTARGRIRAPNRKTVTTINILSESP